MTQSPFAFTINEIANPGDSEDFDQPTFYRSIIGRLQHGLQHLTLTKPDLAFSIDRLCQSLKKTLLLVVASLQKDIEIC